MSASYETLSGMATIGYSRVSTTDQHPEAQAARLREQCCARIFTDHGVSGKTATRPHGPAEKLETGGDRRVAEVLWCVKSSDASRRWLNFLRLVALGARPIWGAGG